MVLLAAVAAAVAAVLVVAVAVAAAAAAVGGGCWRWRWRWRYGTPRTWRRRLFVFGPLLAALSLLVAGCACVARPVCLKCGVELPIATPTPTQKRYAWCAAAAACWLAAACRPRP